MRRFLMTVLLMVFFAAALPAAATQLKIAIRRVRTGPLVSIHGSVTEITRTPMRSSSRISWMFPTMVRPMRSMAKTTTTFSLPACAMWRRRCHS